jgi:hypothetical protein
MDPKPVLLYTKVGQFLPFYRTFSTKGKHRSVVPLVEVWKISKKVFLGRALAGTVTVYTGTVRVPNFFS